ncbi:MAG TPA: hypothetical protein PKJ98_10280 [Verrucomicrobiota bacterium]|nr:hypothetical protein [Verrucomicrobiota bacterium]
MNTFALPLLANRRLQPLGHLSNQLPANNLQSKYPLAQPLEAPPYHPIKTDTL